MSNTYEAEIKQLQQEIAQMKDQLILKEQRVCFLQNKKDQEISKYSSTFSAVEIARYSRQMIMPQVGIGGQISLKNSSVLILGMGGLGCPAALYLAAAGIGRLTIIDNDDVDVTNLHRQVLHTQGAVGMPKVNSAASTLNRLNNEVHIEHLKMHADSKTMEEHLASGKLGKFNAVIDGSDNVATRYLLNDACVLAGVPLISGSALQMEGQLTVYNYKGGPCYRCIFPLPPPAHTVTNCGDGGVLGPVPGVIGVLQALEAIKIITGQTGALNGRLLLFDGCESTFRNVKLRPRNPNCDVCGDNPKIKELIDYEQFCGAKAHDKVIDIHILNDQENVTIEDFNNLNKDKAVIDVRPVLEYAMCKLPNTFNVPYSEILSGTGVEKIKNIIMENDFDQIVYIICRRGNDSQRSVAYLNDNLKDIAKFINVKGGLQAYSKHVDPQFPIY